MKRKGLQNNNPKLIASAKSVLLAYSALEVANQIPYEIVYNGQKRTITLNNFIDNKLQENGSFNGVISINEQKFHLEVSASRSGAGNTIKLQRVPIQARAVPAKSFLDYSFEEQLNLVCQQKLCLTAKQNGKTSIAAYVGEKNHLIGSVDKLPLYRSHLVTLYQMIAHLERGGDIRGMLIALATGSGKTFIQALWMLVIVLSGERGIFALPNKLIIQYLKDLENLLPNEITQEIKVILRKSQHPNQDRHHLANAQLVVASFEELLDQHFVTLKDLPAGSVQLSFDEQHLVMKREARKQKLIKLSQRFQCVLLTATPAEETYRFCGGRPVAVNSSRQKQREGHGRFPRFIQTRAKDLDDKKKISGQSLSLAEHAALTLVNSVSELRSSAAMTVLQELECFDPAQSTTQVYQPSQHSARSAQTIMRWNYQPPMSRKILFQIDDNQELINIHRYVSENSRKEQSWKDNPDLEIYQDGNAVSRRPIYGFFQVDSIYTDRAISNHYQTYQTTDFDRKFDATVDKMGVDAATAHEIKVNLTHDIKSQLDRNIVQGFYEYLIRDLTGLSIHELNEWRLNRPAELLALFKRGLHQSGEKTTDYFQRKLTYHKENNKNGLSQSNASQIANFLSQMLNQVKRHEHRDDYLAHVIDNWSLDKFLINECASNASVWSEMHQFIERHRVVYLMAGMKDADTPIDDSRPFSGFSSEEVKLFNDDGSPNKKAKRRVQLIYEALNTQARETHYSPNYLWSQRENATADELQQQRVDEEREVDNLMRFGFIGMLVSNKKAEGFSDVNLHTVVNVIPQKSSPNNNPATLVQSIGRLRGLDPTQEPYFIEAMGKSAQPVFDLHYLETEEDFYPVYFQGMRQYQQELAVFLGERVAKEILTWIYANQDPSQRLDPEAFNHAVLHFLTRASLELHNANDHDHARMRKLTAKMAEVAIEKLEAEKVQITQPYQSTVKVKVLGNLLFAGSWLAQWFVPWSEGEYSDDPGVKLYWKIINTSDYLDINQQQPVLGMFKTIRDRLTQEIPFQGKKKLFEKLKPMVNKLCHEQLLPALAKWIIDPGQRAEILARARTYDGWIDHFEILEKLGSLQSHRDQGQLIRQVFSCVPATQLDTVEFYHDGAFLQSEQKTLQTAVTKMMADVIKTRVEYFFSHELLPLINTFVTEKDFAVLESLFKDQANIKKLVATLTNANDGQVNVDEEDVKNPEEAKSNITNITPEKFFAVIKKCFPDYPGVKELTLLNSRLEDAFKALQTHLQQAYMGYRWREKWLPLVVKFYDPAIQLQVLTVARNCPNWGAILTSYLAKPEFKKDFEQAGQNPQNMVRWFNSMMNDANVPVASLRVRPDSYQDVAKAAAQRVMSEFKKLGDYKAYLNFSGALAAPGALINMIRGSDKVSPEAFAKEMAKKKLAEYLRGDLVSHLEPFFTVEDLGKLNAVFKGNNAEAVSVRLASQLIDQFVSGQAQPDINALLGLMRACDPSLATIDVVPAMIQTEMQHLALINQLASSNNHDQLNAALQAASRALNPTEQATFNQAVQTLVMPVLLSVFKPEKREQIKQATGTYNKWASLILNNFSLLMKKKDDKKADPEGPPEQVTKPASPFLPLLNLLKQIPGLESLVADDLLDLPGLAQSAITTIKERFATLIKFTENDNDLIAIWKDFLQSEAFLHACDTLMIDTHGIALRQWLQDPKNLAVLAQRIVLMIATAPNSDLTKMIEVIKECSGGLLDIQFLHQTFEALEKSVEKLKELRPSHAEMDTVLKPIFFSHLSNPQFRAMILSVTQLFTLEDYRIFVERVRSSRSYKQADPDPETQARELYVFAQLFNAGNLTAIYRRFVKLDLKELDLGSFERIIYSLADIYDEVLCCHRHHHGIYLGSGSTNPGLLSGAAGGVRVSTQQLHPLLGYTLYLKSVTNGFSEANQASEHTNKATVRQIEQAQSKVLEPVAGDINSWWITRAIKFVGRLIWRGCKAIYFGAVNLYKWIARKCTDEDRHLTDLKSSEPNVHSAKMRDSAVDVTEQLRDARPIPDEKLSEPAVQGDVDKVKKDLKRKHHKKHVTFWEPSPAVPRAQPPKTDETLGPPPASSTSPTVEVLAPPPIHAV